MISTSYSSAILKLLLIRSFKDFFNLFFAVLTEFIHSPEYSEHLFNYFFELFMW